MRVAATMRIVLFDDADFLSCHEDLGCLLLNSAEGLRYLQQGP